MSRVPRKIVFLFAVVIFGTLRATCVGATAQKCSACTTYKVKDGDTSNSIVKSQCNQSNCDKSKKSNAFVRNRKNEMCPSLIETNERVEVCCRRPKPCKIVNVPRDISGSQLVKEQCKCSSGCSRRSSQAPNVIAKETVYCPDKVFKGDNVTVCCDTTSSQRSPRIPQKGTCKPNRFVNKGDRVFITIDDGPSDKARERILNALKNTHTKVTFFESGYNVRQGWWARANNIKLLADTVKQGHMIAAHSDNHFITQRLKTCSYLTVSPADSKSCGTDPIQNMVQGAKLIQEALMHKSVTFSADETKLRDRAIKDVWTSARLPCSNIWRTGKINSTSLPGVRNEKERLARNKMADDMFGGKVKCRPKEYFGIPWKIYGFNPDVDWKRSQIQAQALCDIVNKIEKSMKRENHEQKKNKVVLLTHDYLFTSDSKAKVLTSLIEELKVMGYTLDVIRNYHSAPSSKNPDSGSPTPSSPAPVSGSIDLQINVLQWLVGICSIILSATSSYQNPL